MKRGRVRRGQAWVACAALMLMFIASSCLASPRDEVASLVRLIGFGGAIHNFKNYVLRGDHRISYAVAARAQFQEAVAIVDKLQNEPSLAGEYRESLEGIRQTLESYLRGLKQIEDLFEKGWRLEDIDRVVIVDDTPALQGLSRLREKWQWSLFEELEYQLGYGASIHNFKNYVLRSDDIYHTQALEHLLAAQSLLAELLSQPGLDDRQRMDYQAIQRVSHAYMEYLALVERLIRSQRPVRQIDLAVKVNDRPALHALDSLRAR